MTFDDLKLAETLLRAVKAEGYTTPTPIQQQAIPHVLAGKDVLGCAQTGTGKTAAFTLPILQRLTEGRPPPPARGRPIRALVLSPTRELAAQ
ncbi:MAG TPA: DEAD/DEAH box helicase, partial [Myxococcaceae bacterium]|nr:DEAD/DEAH box helicase [Myxococcaceae bacterium]